MRRLGFTVGVATFMAALFAGQAYAAPTCTGTTLTVTNGGSATEGFLSTAGNCVLAGDKLIGDFTSTGLGPTGDTVSFSWPSIPGNVTLGIEALIGASATATISYEVAVDAALAKGFLIDDLEKDFTFNAINLGTAATATLTGTTTPTTTPAVAIDCTRSLSAGGVSSETGCPGIAIFNTIADLTIHQTLTTGANTEVTEITDTISQRSTVPEPTSLLLLGGALVGLGVIRRRR